MATAPFKRPLEKWISEDYSQTMIITANQQLSTVIPKKRTQVCLSHEQ